MIRNYRYDSAFLRTSNYLKLFCRDFILKEYFPSKFEIFYGFFSTQQYSLWFNISWFSWNKIFLQEIINKSTFFQFRHLMTYTKILDPNSLKNVLRYLRTPFHCFSYVFQYIIALFACYYYIFPYLSMFVHKLNLKTPRFISMVGIHNNSSLGILPQVSNEYVPQKLHLDTAL